MTEERLRILSELQDVLSPDHKKEIRDACKEAGITIKFKSGCPNCYSDALVALWHSMKKEGILTDSGNYRFMGNRTTYLIGRDYRLQLNEHTPDSVIEMCNDHTLYVKVDNNKKKEDK